MSLNTLSSMTVSFRERRLTQKRNAYRAEASDCSLWIGRNKVRREHQSHDYAEDKSTHFTSDSPGTI